MAVVKEEEDSMGRIDLESIEVAEIGPGAGIS
jgi:hypothetical protein